MCFVMYFVVKTLKYHSNRVFRALGVLKTIIEVAQSRGAFKANELEAVGKTYSKLETFLASIQNQQVAKDPNAPAPATAPATAPAGEPIDPTTGEVK